MKIRLLLILAAGLACGAAARADEAVATAQSLCDALLTAMKQGSSLDFKGREARLAPEVRKDLDLALMTRLVVGPPWRSMPAADQQALTQAFGDYTVATYTQSFKSFSGERFEVDPAPTPAPTGNGDLIVHTKLYPPSGGAVQLDYLERREASGWKIIDILLNGSISQMAARRSEYSSTLRQGGAPALIALLRQKTADLGN